MRGIFISIEGADGSGKTTQMKMLKEYFESRGKEVILTREPGGTEIGEKIRSIILDQKNKNMCHVTEMMLYAAARAQLVEEKIFPARENGKIIISDRFVDSSAVYQGIARGLGIDMVYTMNQYAINLCEPDITFLLDIDAEQGIERKKDQKNLDRMEEEKIEFHQMVVEGYRNLAKKYPERIFKIDGTQSPEEVHMEMIDRLKQMEK